MTIPPGEFFPITNSAKAGALTSVSSLVGTGAVAMALSTSVF